VVTDELGRALPPDEVERGVSELLLLAGQVEVHARKASWKGSGD
jgi:hypothetical protein